MPAEIEDVYFDFDWMATLLLPASVTVLNDPSVHAIHAERVRNADLRFPMDAMVHGSRLCMLDGLHRLVRHVQQGHRRVSVRIVPRSMIPQIARESPSGDHA